MISVKILLRNKPRNDGFYPVVLRAIKDRKVKLISLGLHCKKTDWDESNSKFKKSHPEYMRRNRLLLELQSRAYKVIDEFIEQQVDFTLNQFESKFRFQKISDVTVKDFWLAKIDDLNKAERTGNARAYKDTMNSFFRFERNQNISFREIDFEKLDKYETYLRSTGSNNGGIAVRMREIRALYNEAIKKGIAQLHHYPFKEYKISKLKSTPVKRALTRDEVRSIENLDESEYPLLAFSKKLFVFSYYTCGMNFYDMMKLKWSNIEGDRIVYMRSKTKHSFSIQILEPVKDILEFYSQHNKGTEYIFPLILNSDMSPIQIENRKAKTLKKYNRDLKEIARVLGIQKSITSYVARHSYATNMRQLGTSPDIISQSMGHKNVSITMTYLRELDSETIDGANKKLLEESKCNYHSSYKDVA